MKKLVCLVLALALALCLTACGCKHEAWYEADCTTPKTCTECGETEGAPLGHSWMVATCEDPKTCEVCGATDGSPLGHNWVDATCEAPKTCKACDLTEGEALGHSWMDATTEAPKTCQLCALTEGERIITDERFTTAATKDLHGTWVSRIDMGGEMMGLADFEGTLAVNLIMEMTNDGHLSMGIEIEDQDAFKESMKGYMMKMLYDELAAAGVSKDNADEILKASYGMGAEEYVDYTLSQMDFNSLLGTFNFKMVYYAEGSTLYTSTVWTAEMTTNEFSVDGDQLTIVNMATEMGYGEGDLTFTRVTE